MYLAFEIVGYSLCVAFALADADEIRTTEINTALDTVI